MVLGESKDKKISRNLIRCVTKTLSVPLTSRIEEPEDSFVSTISDVTTKYEIFEI